MIATRYFCLLIFGLALTACSATAQVPDAEAQIRTALAPAPANLRDGATVMGYAADGTLTMLREGTNELICIADAPGNDRFHAACYHRSLEAYMARGRALRAEGITGQASFNTRHAEADAGTLPMPDRPAAVINVSGTLDEVDLDAPTVTLYAVYIPYATEATTGIPETPGPSGTPWLMRPGTASAHIMIIPPR